MNREITIVVNQGKHTKVILSNPRLVPGHLLVLPNRHVEKLSELDEEERRELFEKVIEFQEKILSKFAKGCDIRQHYRPFQKQDNIKVNHAHVHLNPREPEDELYKKSQVFEKQMFSELTEEDKEKFIKLFS